MHTFKVFRYNPDEPARTRYDVFPVPVKGTTSVLEGLIHIFEKMDPSLAWRYSCRSSVCGSCAMKINGRYRLACKTLVRSLKTSLVIIEPLANLPVLKDLVVDMSLFYEKYEIIEPYLVPKHLPPGHKEFYQSPESRRNLEKWIACILCGSCYSACTMCYWDNDFPGPFAFLAAAARFQDERDVLGWRRIADLSSESGIYRCHSELACTAVCPKNLSPTEAINQLKREAFKQGLKAIFRKNISRRIKKPQKKAPIGFEEPQEGKSSAPLLDRKSFLQKIFFLFSGMISALVLGIFSLPLFQKEASEANTWIRAGKIPRELDKKPRELIYVIQRMENGKLIEYSQRAYVMKNKKGRIVALDPTCTHLGCACYWEESMRLFICPCHGGAFDQEGNVRLGPPPAGLKELDVMIDKDSIYLKQKEKPGF